MWIIEIIKIKCFYPPRILNEHWCIYSCLQIPPRENWFQYVRRVYATAINFPCIITLGGGVFVCYVCLINLVMSTVLFLFLPRTISFKKSSNKTSFSQSFLYLPKLSLHEDLFYGPFRKMHLHPSYCVIIDYLRKRVDNKLFG